MCGLVGIAGNLLFQDEFTMKRMLLADFFRGEHSTGMAAVRSSGDTVLAKIASNPIDLFGLKQFQDALNGNASRAFIGHNRQATRGQVNTVNAHPFRFGHIIGAHNGTLDYESVHRLEDKLGEKFSVDSMALIAGIEKLGIKETIGLCNEGKDSKDGAWAIVWWDKNEGTLNFLRNKHRPLFYAYEEGFKKLFWASEWWMIREAMEASPNGYKLYSETTGDKNIGYFNFDVDVHYSFKLDELCAGSKKRPKPRAKPLRGREPKAVGYSGNVTPLTEWPRPTAQTTSGTHGGTVGNQNSAKKTGGSSRNNSSSRELIQLSGTHSPYAGVVNETRFAMLSQNGCMWCKTPVKYGNLGITVFEREGVLLCKKCSGYPEGHPNPPNRIYVRAAEFDTFR